MKSALIPWFARIPVRTGWKGEHRFGLLNDMRSNKSAFPLMVEAYLALAYPKAQMKSRADIPTIPQPALNVDLINQEKALERLGLDRARPVLVLCPGPSSARPSAGRRATTPWWRKTPRRGLAGVDLRLRQGRGGGQHHPRPDQPAVAPQLPRAGGQDQSVRGDRPDGAGRAGDRQRLRPDARRRRPQPAADRGLWLHLAALHPPLADRVEIVHTDIECRPCFKRTCKFGHLKCLIELMPEQVIEAGRRLECSETPARRWRCRPVNRPFVAEPGKRGEPH